MANISGVCGGTLGGARAQSGGLGDEVPQKLKHFCIYNDKFCQYVEGHSTTEVYFTHQLHLAFFIFTKHFTYTLAHGGA